MENKKEGDVVEEFLSFDMPDTDMDFSLAPSMELTI